MYVAITGGGGGGLPRGHLDVHGVAVADRCAAGCSLLLGSI